jgi:hypothetical protein
MNMEANTYDDQILAEETHCGRVWGLIILLAVIGPAISVYFYPRTPAFFALVVTSVIGLGAFLMAWSGFQYRFLQNSVEIRSLGFKLRSIPRQAILSYSIESWAFVRGYGVRGIGRSRAYVWGNKVVHIRTTNGEVYLGHSDPGQIIRDLNMVTGFATQA